MTAVDVGVDRNIAITGIEDGAAFHAPVDRGRCALQLHLPAADRGGERNAVVGCLDHAAHRLRAVAQRLGPAVDLDLLGRERIDRHAVVLSVFGHVHGADAVLLHAHAEVVEPAQHWPLRAGSETGGGGTGRGEEEPADALALVCLDLRSGHRGERRVGRCRRLRARLRCR